MNQESPPPDSKWLRRALGARFVLLGFYVVLSLAWYFVFLSQYDPLRIGFYDTGGNAADILAGYLVGTLILFGVQFLLLLGAPQLRWPKPRRRRSVFISLAVGSAIAMLLSAGIFFACVSLRQLIFNPGSFHIKATPRANPAATQAAASEVAFWCTVLGFAGGGWIFWFLIFGVLGAGEWSRRFHRMYRILIAGTILELLITIPIDAQVRRRTNCYCGEGTFFSLIVGLTAILWTFGPGVAILFLIRRNQLLAASGRCLECGYDLRGLESPRCPECGTAFKRA